MKILAIDTASDAATVAVTEDGIVLGEYVLNHKKTHSQKIMVMIERLLNDLEIEVSDIDLFAAAKGPGSFTGLRIGVATIKALAHSVNKDVVGVSTLEGIAYNIPYADGLIAVIMDARRNQVFNAVYKWENGILNEVFSPDACDIYEFLEKIKNEKVIFTGDGVNVHKEKIEEFMGDGVLFAPESVRMSKASSVAYAAKLLAERGNTLKYTDLIPEYLRLSQAERELMEKQKKGDIK